MKKMIIVGAGPGDKELITIKGKNAIESADILIYAGSLVNPEVLDYNKKGAKIYNSATMTLDEVIDVAVNGIKNELTVVRVHTGDPALYGAIKEQIDELKTFENSSNPYVSSEIAALIQKRKMSMNL